MAKSEGKIDYEGLAKEFIIGFGVLEGLWIYAGVNPMNEVVGSLSRLAPEGTFSIFGWVSAILLVITFVQIVSVYALGGVVGLIALLLGFLGGMFIGAGIWGIVMIAVAFYLGWWSFKNDNNITISDVIDFVRKVTRA